MSALPFDATVTEHGLFNVPLARDPITPEQQAAWNEYQRARADFGLLTSREYAMVVGGAPSDEYLDMDARR